MLKYLPAALLVLSHLFRLHIRHNGSKEYIKGTRTARTAHTTSGRCVLLPELFMIQNSETNEAWEVKEKEPRGIKGQRDREHSFSALKSAEMSPEGKGSGVAEQLQAFFHSSPQDFYS